MKKIIYLALLVAVAPCYAATIKENVEEAIAQSSLSRLKSLLLRVEREEMTLDERKKLYLGFYDRAADRTIEIEDKISLFGTWRDYTKVGLGFASTLLGTVLVRDFDSRVGLVLEVAGVYAVYKGMRCSSQRAVVDEARQVEKYLNRKVEELSDETV